MQLTLTHVQVSVARYCPGVHCCDMFTCVSMYVSKFCWYVCTHVDKGICTREVTRTVYANVVSRGPLGHCCGMFTCVSMYVNKFCWYVCTHVDHTHCVCTCGVTRSAYAHVGSHALRMHMWGHTHCACTCGVTRSEFATAKYIFFSCLQ
jgi:hypothetical protein